jgi:sugar lactone lactonase YvrE
LTLRAASIARFLSPPRPAGSGFEPEGNLLVAGALDGKLWAIDPSGQMIVRHDLSALTIGLLNDMIVDGAGRAWVGDTGFNLASHPPRIFAFTLEFQFSG